MYLTDRFEYTKIQEAASSIGGKADKSECNPVKIGSHTVRERIGNMAQDNKNSGSYWAHRANKDRDSEPKPARGTGASPSPREENPINERAFQAGRAAESRERARQYREVEAKREISREATVNFEPVKGASEPMPTASNSGRRKSSGAKKKSGGMSPFVKTFSYVICVFGVSVLLATLIILVGNDMLGLLKPEGEVAIPIEAGADLNEITALLKENNVIQYPWAFKLFASLSKKNIDYKERTYLLNTEMGYSEIFSTLRSTSNKKQTVMVTIPEGKEQREIAEILAEKGVCSAEDFMNACNTGTYDYSFLENIPDRPSRLEGYLFPDTYEFYVGEENPENVVKRFLDNFANKFTEEMLAKVNKSGLTLDEIVTLASIIEREAASDSDRATVSSVFWNRLNSKQYPYLQSCATVQYVLQERKAILSVEDTRIESPYNTYQNKGLPEGPISSPGVASLKAALEPEKTDYYFFVVSASGEHVFSTNYEEHLKAVKDARSSQGIGTVTEENQ